MIGGSRSLNNVCAALMLAALLAGGLLAQSGRRPKTPVAIPSATPEATPAAGKTPEEEKRLTIVVGIDRYSDVSDIPLSFYTSVLSSCTERLDDSKSVKVSSTIENMSRADAFKRAKDEKEAYVVSLELKSTSTRVGFQTTRDLNDVYVDYSVFAPATAKVVTSGKRYQREGASKGGVIVNQPSGGRTTIGDNDYLLKQAARAAAERILAAFRLNVPGGPVALDHGSVLPLSFRRKALQ